MFVAAHRYSRGCAGIGNTHHVGDTTAAESAAAHLVWDRLGGPPPNPPVRDNDDHDDDRLTKKPADDDEDDDQDQDQPPPLPWYRVHEAPHETDTSFDILMTQEHSLMGHWAHEVNNIADIIRMNASDVNVEECSALDALNLSVQKTQEVADMHVEAVAAVCDAQERDHLKHVRRLQNICSDYQRLQAYKRDKLKMFQEVWHRSQRRRMRTYDDFSQVSSLLRHFGHLISKQTTRLLAVAQHNLPDILEQEQEEKNEKESKPKDKPSLSRAVTHVAKGEMDTEPPQTLRAVSYDTAARTEASRKLEEAKRAAGDISRAMRLLERPPTLFVAMQGETSPSTRRNHRRKSASSRSQSRSRSRSRSASRGSSRPSSRSSGASTNSRPRSRPGSDKRTRTPVDYQRRRSRTPSDAERLPDDTTPRKKAPRRKRKRRGSHTNSSRRGSHTNAPIIKAKMRARRGSLMRTKRKRRNGRRGSRLSVATSAADEADDDEDDAAYESFVDAAVTQSRTKRTAHDHFTAALHRHTRRVSTDSLSSANVSVAASLTHEAQHASVSDVAAMAMAARVTPLVTAGQDPFAAIAGLETESTSTGGDTTFSTDTTSDSSEEDEEADKTNATHEEAQGTEPSSEHIRVEHDGLTVVHTAPPAESPEWAWVCGSGRLALLPRSGGKALFDRLLTRLKSTFAKHKALDILEDALLEPCQEDVGINYDRINSELASIGAVEGGVSLHGASVGGSGLSAVRAMGSSAAAMLTQHRAKIPLQDRAAYVRKLLARFDHTLAALVQADLDRAAFKNNTKTILTALRPYAEHFGIFYMELHAHSINVQWILGFAKPPFSRSYQSMHSSMAEGVSAPFFANPNHVSMGLGSDGSTWWNGVPSTRADDAGLVDEDASDTGSTWSDMTFSDDDVDPDSPKRRPKLDRRKRKQRRASRERKSSSARRQDQHPLPPLHEKAVIGIIVDLHGGAVRCSADGSNAVTVFGQGAAHYPNDIQAAQAERIRAGHLVPVLALRGAVTDKFEALLKREMAADVAHAEASSPALVRRSSVMHQGATSAAGAVPPQSVGKRQGMFGSLIPLHATDISETVQEVHNEYHAAGAQPVAALMAPTQPLFTMPRVSVNFGCRQFSHFPFWVVGQKSFARDVIARQMYEQRVLGNETALKLSTVARNAAALERQQRERSGHGEGSKFARRAHEVKDQAFVQLRRDPVYLWKEDLASLGVILPTDTTHLPSAGVGSHESVRLLLSTEREARMREELIAFEEEKQRRAGVMVSTRASGPAAASALARVTKLSGSSLRERVLAVRLSKLEQEKKAFLDSFNQHVLQSFSRYPPVTIRIQQAVLVMQRVTRRFLRRRRAQREGWKMERAAMAIQIRFRYWLSKQQKIRTKAVVPLQALFRGVRVRKSIRLAKRYDASVVHVNAAATKIQSVIRMLIAKRRVRMMAALLEQRIEYLQHVVVFTQRMFRRRVAQKQLMSNRATLCAALIFQKSFRAVRLRRRLAELEPQKAKVASKIRDRAQEGRTKTAAALKIQALYRSRVDRRFAQVKRDVVRQDMCLLRDAFRAFKLRRAIDARHGGGDGMDAVVLKRFFQRVVVFRDTE